MFLGSALLSSEEFRVRFRALCRPCADSGFIILPSVQCILSDNDCYITDSCISTFTCTVMSPIYMCVFIVHCHFHYSYQFVYMYTV